MTAHCNSPRVPASVTHVPREAWHRGHPILHVCTQRPRAPGPPQVLQGPVSYLSPGLLLRSCSIPAGIGHRGAPGVGVMLLFIESSSIDEAVCNSLRQSVIRSGLLEDLQPCMAQCPGLQDSGDSRWTRAPAEAELPGREASLQHLCATPPPHLLLGGWALPRSARCHPSRVLR